MKLKDIKNKLKAEQSQVRVPDMLGRVQKAPINKLLSGETPAQAFQKKLAIRLLVTATALLIVAVFCFGAMMLHAGNGEAQPLCYAVIRAQSETGEANFDLVTSGDLFDVVCVDQSTGEKMSLLAISALHELKSTDKVAIAVICDDRTVATNVVQSLKEELVATYSGQGELTVQTSVNAQSEIELLKQRIEALGGQPKEDIAELVEIVAALI